MLAAMVSLTEVVGLIEEFVALRLIFGSLLLLGPFQAYVSRLMLVSQQVDTPSLAKTRFGTIDVAAAQRVWGCSARRGPHCANICVVGTLFHQGGVSAVASCDALVSCTQSFVGIGSVIAPWVLSCVVVGWAF